ncbi:MAG: terpene cyclase/mutase family protein [Planctomycetaceae bacterium]|nr:terpene cyclase/mutase family protein [Planctomycetaceae bacterium]
MLHITVFASVLCFSGSMLVRLNFKPCQSGQSCGVVRWKVAVLVAMLAPIIACGASGAEPLRLVSLPAATLPGPADAEVDAAVRQSLDYLASLQRKNQGYWEANQSQYKAAMTALAGTAMLAEGSTTTSGPYASNIRQAVNYLLAISRPNGLIGDHDDAHYTYGHGFSMLFLSQVYGEEESERDREEIREVLVRAVQFCADAQTSKGGWGYVSAKEGSDFDEGSTCITQVQGLRACRNAGIPVSKEIIDRAKRYIEDCTLSNGAVQYSIRGGGGRPPITAAALAAMFNAGEYDTDLTNSMRTYCRTTIWPGKQISSGGSAHWHYTHFYYSQVIYRQGGDEWNQYRKEVAEKLIGEMRRGGGWSNVEIGDVYATSLNCIILQLDKGFLPIYQR